MTRLRTIAAFLDVGGAAFRSGPPKPVFDSQAYRQERAETSAAISACLDRMHAQADALEAALQPLPAKMRAAQ